MKIQHLNSVNELVNLRNFLGRYGQTKGLIKLMDCDTKESYNIGGQKWGGGSTTSCNSKDYIVGRFLQEELDRDVMCKIIEIMKEGADKIDAYLAKLGVTVNDK